MNKVFFDPYLPLILANVLHMFIVKYDVWPMLKIPIHEKTFGKNKTLRGFLFVGVFTSLFYTMFSLYDSSLQDKMLTGFLLGLSFVFFELPNSFMKRKMGIAPGEKATKNKFFFNFIDKADSALGVSLMYCYLKGLGFSTFVILFFGALMTHFIFSTILFRLRIKESV